MAPASFTRSRHLQNVAGFRVRVAPPTFSLGQNRAAVLHPRTTHKPSAMTFADTQILK
jgi:hypothetical protein